MGTDDVVQAGQAVEGLLQRFFGSVSFDGAPAPDYEAVCALFLAGGLLITTSTGTPQVASVREFIDSRQRMVDSGELTAFAEWERSGITEVFGNVAHRLSTYGKRGTRNGADFDGAGVISTQFVATPDGWRMSAMAWDDERAGLEIPERYRP
ncbi:hypothetical protein [Pseudonocardia sp. GCM10023141]|uniref:hypothetical protein n=1 Tax=Pseudonocardia sp. GCM10023141 TaxID=3252653 RepID=UPI00361AC603